MKRDYDDEMGLDRENSLDQAAVRAIFKLTASLEVPEFTFLSFRRKPESSYSDMFWIPEQNSFFHQMIFGRTPI